MTDRELRSVLFARKPGKVASLRVWVQDRQELVFLGAVLGMLAVFAGAFGEALQRTIQVVR